MKNAIKSKFWELYKFDKIVKNIEHYQAMHPPPSATTHPHPPRLISTHPHPLKIFSTHTTYGPITHIYSNLSMITR